LLATIAKVLYQSLIGECGGLGTHARRDVHEWHRHLVEERAAGWYGGEEYRQLVENGEFRKAPGRAAQAGNRQSAAILHDLLLQVEEEYRSIFARRNDHDRYSCRFGALSPLIPGHDDVGQDQKERLG
jgi:hypothetical protein